jgi:hypothetical protein
MMFFRRSFGLLATLTSSSLLASAAHAAPPRPAKRPATAMHSTTVRAKDVTHAGKEAKKDAERKDGEKKDAAKVEPKKTEPKQDAGKKADPKAEEKDKANAFGKESDKGKGKAKVAKEKPPCLRFPVMFARGTEERAFALTMCDGTPAPMAAEQLSVLARPDSATKPPGIVRASVGGEVAPGVKRLDDRLVQRLQTIVDHFHKPGPVQKVRLVSGYRPASKGSFHATGAAIDFRIDGVTNEQLVAFCKTLPDTGCGYYPNSTFIHMDVRPPGSGHVSWIDASGPGEPARYVSQWPPPPEPTPRENANAPLDRILPDLPRDEHPATASDLAAGPTEPPLAREGDDAREDGDPL